MEVSLVMFTPSGERREFKVGKKTIIGRNTESHIQIPLPIVSRRHCELRIEDERVLVRDLGSSNGTYINNNRIQQSELHVGDTLTVGPVIFTAVIDGRPTEIQPILTVLDNPKPSRKPPSPKPKNPDDTGSVDLDNSGSLDILLDDHKDHSAAPLEFDEHSKPNNG
jgi:pSer/pThr/pTyr-binding forkhead associated (FHA) protein